MTVPVTPAAPVVPEVVPPVAPQVEAKPPWGTPDEFNPEKAWDLITKLREQKNDPAVARELETLRADKSAREDSERTEAEKAQVRIKAAEDKAAETAAELTRTKAALKWHLSEEDATALEGIPADRVDAIAERLAGKAVVTPKAPSPAGQGDVGGPVGDGLKQITDAELQSMNPAEINKARAEGRLKNLLG